jgi:hypothetical protein
MFSMCLGGSKIESTKVELKIQKFSIAKSPIKKYNLLIIRQRRDTVK